MISQPRIESAVRIYRTCLWITSSSCTRVQTYLRFKLRFKPSAYLYLRTSLKTKDCHLGLLQSLLSSNSSSIIRLPRGLVGTHTTKGAKYLHDLCSYQSVLVLGQPSDVSDLVPSHLVSISPTKSHVFRHITICLSQVYSCSDCYIRAGDNRMSEHI